MSTKKRFTIAPDLASGIRNTMQSATTNQGQLHYDLMPLDAIQPDPRNPRRLAISRAEMLDGLDSSDPDYDTKQVELQALLELGESIKRIGIRSAIEVYKDGSTYRIITGERRYWAAMLVGQKSVPVRINQKPDEFNLRYTQWVENINRQDLSLWEKFNNLALIADAYHQLNQGELDASWLQHLLNISQIQAYRYLCLLKADEKILQLIEQGKLNNLKIIQELVAMKDKGARSQILSWIASSKNEITSLAQYQQAAGKKSFTSAAKNKSAISLGKINNADVAKHLLEMIFADPRMENYHYLLQQVDWYSAKSITKTFKSLFKILEKECQVKELT